MHDKFERENMIVKGLLFVASIQRELIEDFSLEKTLEHIDVRTNIRQALPSALCHNETCEFADAVRGAMERWEVEAIAVELPSTLEGKILQAVRRLPPLCNIHGSRRCWNRTGSRTVRVL